MSRIRIYTAVGLIVAGVVLAPWGRAAEPAPALAKPAAPADTERELKQLLADRAEEIDRLKLENARLKREIRELKSRQAAVLPQVPRLQLAPPAPAAPKNAIPREFNGDTYYLVPLDEAPERKSAGTIYLSGENQTPTPASNLSATKTGR
jgi:hypothetical protein